MSYEYEKEKEKESNKKGQSIIFGRFSDEYC